MCIDGPAGSGKTTLANSVAEECGFNVVHLDDLYPGWDGLDGFEPLALSVLDALAAGRPGSCPRYDWRAREYVGTIRVGADRGLVLEGVGAGNRALAANATVQVWMDVPISICDQRWRARDGALMDSHVAEWRAAEERLFAREQTQSRADISVVPNFR